MDKISEKKLEKKIAKIRKSVWKDCRGLIDYLESNQGKLTIIGDYLSVEVKKSNY